MIRRAYNYIKCLIYAGARIHDNNCFQKPQVSFTIFLGAASVYGSAAVALPAETMPEPIPESENPHGLHRSWVSGLGFRV